jgi:hypothetical protein
MTTRAVVALAIILATFYAVFTPSDPPTDTFNDARPMRQHIQDVCMQELVRGDAQAYLDCRPN